MTKRVLRLFGVLMVIALLATACGGDDDTTDTTGASGESEASSDTEGTDPSDEVGDTAPDPDTDPDMADMGEDGHSHGGVLEVPAGMAVPEIEIELTEDPKAGYNLAVALENFTVTPENASLEPVDGEGHMHLYIDGERELRFYNHWLHLNLPEGDHVIEVEVSANNHSAYAVDGEAIRASAEVSVGPAAEHSHAGDMTFDVAAADAPAVTMTIVEDPKSGWNLHAPVENFTIAPEQASTDPVAGVGHMHLYIDGKKITRLYGEWWHISELSEGDHEIMVEVSANNHAPYTVDGTGVVAVTTLAVSTDQVTAPAGEEARSDDHEDGTDMAMDEADVVIDVAIVDGAVEVDDDRIAVGLGQTVAVVVTSDVAEHVHVHGYDLYGDLTPGETTKVVFEASIPGVFEIELEGSGTLITELEVS